jgi:diguanylate cyclase (GGDEF)-like protein
MAMYAVMLALLAICWWYRRRAFAAEALADELAAEAQAQAYAANHDPLTGLANRRAFYLRGEQLLRDPHELPALGVLLDLDGFKQVNDTLGHAAGDEVLAVLGRRLSGFARDGLVGRLGGDEFAALLRYEPPAGSSYPILEQMAAAVAAPILVAGHQVRVTASVGHTTVSTTTALADVLRNADAAMYRAKANGRSVTRINPIGALPPEQAAHLRAVHAATMNFGTDSAGSGEAVPRRAERRRPHPPARPSSRADGPPAAAARRASAAAVVPGGPAPLPASPAGPASRPRADRRTTLPADQGLRATPAQ